MKIDVIDDKKTVTIWLTKAESQDKAIAAELLPLYKKYHKEKYTVAVFHSGKEELAQLTSDLLCYNRKKLAELEMKGGRKGVKRSQDFER